MSRFSNPVAQYSDGDGVPLPGSELSFFEPGTTTDKDTFSDSGLTTANSNPVVADSDGRIPSIFLDGTYAVVLKNAAGSTIWTRDPVGDTTEGQFETWLNDNTYNIPDLVKGSDNKFYRSLTNANQGNDPTSSAANWEEIEFERIFNTNVTYALGDRSIGSDGFEYTSKTASNTGNDPTSDSTNWGTGINDSRIDGSVVTGVILPRGYISGLVTSNGTDTDHDIDTAVGECVDSTNAVNITLSSSITKQIDANWVEGTDLGGFPSGLTLTADTWYHYFVIAKADGTVDSGWDTSLSASNLLADATDFTLFRRIASHLTDGSSNIIAYFQTANEFLWDVPVSDLSQSNPGTTAVTAQLSVPTSIVVSSIVVYRVTDTSPVGLTAVLVTALKQADTVPTSTLLSAATDVSAEISVVSPRIETDVSAQIRFRFDVSTTGHSIRITTFGWIDFRGNE